MANAAAASGKVAGPREMPVGAGTEPNSASIVSIFDSQYNRPIRVRLGMNIGRCLLKPQ